MSAESIGKLPTTCERCDAKIDFSEIVQRAERSVNDLESAGAFLRGPFFEAMVGRAIQQAIHASQSPFVNRADAAARWRCSESEIDRAARRGVLTRFWRNESPMYLKEQGDEAIRLGKWKHQTSNNK